MWSGLAYGAEQKKNVPLAFVYLQFLMMLILAHYFAAHGSSMGPKTGSGSALGLPRGTIRFVLLVGYLGLAWFLFKERASLAFETLLQGRHHCFPRGDSSPASSSCSYT